MQELLTPRDLGFVSIVGGGIAPYTRLQILNETRRSVICSVIVEGNVSTEGTNASAGQVMIHPANRPFTELSSTPGVHEWIGFRFETLHPIWSTHRLGSVATLSDFQKTTSAFHTLSSALKDGTASQQGEAFYRYLNQIEPVVPAQTYGRPNRFDFILRHIGKCIDTDLGRTKLAEMAGMHPNAFDRAFRIEIGLTSQEYVRGVRIARAKTLVCDASQTLDSVAFAIGLSSAAYFSRWFKIETGQSPTEYRDSVKKPNDGYFKSYGGE